MTGNDPKAHLSLKRSRNATFHPVVDTTCNLVMPHTNKGQRTKRRGNFHRTRTSDSNSPKSAISATERRQVGKVNAHSLQEGSHAKVK